MDDTAAALASLENVLETLLGPEGCPWDKEQTPGSLCDYLAEETFELIDAVRKNDPAAMREEMGDVLFLLLFIARMAKNEFSLADALTEAAAKMIRRHPHVFAGSSCESREELLKVWEAIKREEKSAKAEKNPGVFASLPEGLPPLLKAYRIHSKAARADFTWDEDADVEQQVEAEWLEWLDASQSDDPARQGHELGDLLFTLVELGRRKGIKAAAALDTANARFLSRFAFMEQKAAALGKTFAECDMEQKNAWWEEAKAAEKRETP